MHQTSRTTSFDVILKTLRRAMFALVTFTVELEEDGCTVGAGSSFSVGSCCVGSDAADAPCAPSLRAIAPSMPTPMILDSSPILCGGMTLPRLAVGCKLGDATRVVGVSTSASTSASESALYGKDRLSLSASTPPLHGKVSEASLHIDDGLPVRLRVGTRSKASGCGADGLSWCGVDGLSTASPAQLVMLLASVAWADDVDAGIMWSWQLPQRGWGLRVGDGSVVGSVRARRTALPLCRPRVNRDPSAIAAATSSTSSAAHVVVWVCC